MMKVNRKVLLFFASVLCIASLFAWLENRSSESETKKSLVLDEFETLKANNPNKNEQVKTEKKIPHFVAGRTALVEQAKKVYQDEKENEKDEMLLGSKLSSKPISQNQVIFFQSVNTSFINDLYACSQDECPKAGAAIAVNGFNIYKGNAPRSLSSKSNALVTYDKEINQYGIWQGRVIIETLAPIDLTPKLVSMKFEAIERPQDTLFIAQYTGNTSNLDTVLNEIKNISNVSKVRLEITYSRNRGN